MYTFVKNLQGTKSKIHLKVAFNILSTYFYYLRPSGKQRSPYALNTTGDGLEDPDGDSRYFLSSLCVVYDHKLITRVKGNTKADRPHEPLHFFLFPFCSWFHFTFCLGQSLSEQYVRGVYLSIYRFIRKALVRINVLETTCRPSLSNQSITGCVWVFFTVHLKVVWSTISKKNPQNF